MVFLEYNKRNSEHRAINRALVKIFSSIYSDKEDSYVACYSDYYESVFEGIDVNILFKKSSHPTDSLILSMLFESFDILKYLTFNRDDTLVILSASPIGRLVLSLAIKLGLCRSQTIYFVMHSEYSVLFSNCSGIKKKIYRILMALSLVMVRNRVTHVLLGCHIPILSKYIGDRYLRLEHPVENTSIDPTPNRVEADPLVISYVGMASHHKGYGEFLRVAELCLDLHYYKFQVIGRVVKADFVFNRGLEFQSTEYISDERVEELLISTDLALFFYDDSYNYIASGAVLDCIRYGIPIVCRRNKLFEWLSSKYNFVLVFDSSYDVLDFIMNRSNVTSFIKQSNFVEAQFDFSIDGAIDIVKKYRNIHEACV